MRDYNQQRKNDDDDHDDVEDNDSDEQYNDWVRRTYHRDQNNQGQGYKARPYGNSEYDRPYFSNENRSEETEQSSYEEEEVAETTTYVYSRYN